MNIVSVINYKGGVGKTTVTTNLAAEMAVRGYHVLLIDLDPQASLTFSFVPPDLWDRDLAKARTIKSWFDSFLSQSVRPLTDLAYPIPLAQVRGRGKLDLIPSHLGLINVDLELAVELGGRSLKQVKRSFIRVHHRLADGLSKLTDDDYDLVIIDCPPSFNIVTKTAVVASQHILIPARPDYLSTLGIDYLLRNVKQLVRHYNECLDAETETVVEPIGPAFSGIVFTMVQEYGGSPIAANKTFMTRAEQWGIPVFRAYIKENKSLFAEAPQNGVPVVLTPPRDDTHRNVIGQIHQFVTEFETTLGLERRAPHGQRRETLGWNHLEPVGGVA
jgi:chromosome partitioning protein